jgi:hypothetical protein
MQIVKRATTNEGIVLCFEDAGGRVISNTMSMERWAHVNIEPRRGSSALFSVAEDDKVPWAT